MRWLLETKGRDRGGRWRQASRHVLCYPAVDVVVVVVIEKDRRKMVVDGSAQVEMGEDRSHSAGAVVNRGDRNEKWLCWGGCSWHCCLVWVHVLYAAASGFDRRGLHGRGRTEMGGGDLKEKPVGEEALCLIAVLVCPGWKPGWLTLTQAF